ncbi:hypothetical protein [Vibrio methylphosphonaticus]|uniref:hypothetical protein n=1 Tax=Vibrio methylphosphonaticus TaxID=2946866 RepID=UPI00202A796C|nr:hypothetical protein [Vibrio methylphosphonaticus]MCL9776246.1 hypothetical protein [Vibrio methylphosphonaticus]
MKNTILFITTLGMVTACGGGGGGGDSTGGGTPTPAPIQTPATTPTAASRTMADLSIPDELDYNPVEEYALSVDASGEVSGRALVSVYTDFTIQSSGEALPVYDSRIASVSLQSGKGNIDFSSAEHVDEFLLEIWTHDGNPPLQKIVSADTENLVW